MTDFSFDSSKHKISPQGLPYGKYRVRITGAEMKESQNLENPYYLSIGFEVLTGEDKGAIHQEFVNLWHSKTVVRKIAQDFIAIIARESGKEIHFTSANDVNEAFANRFLVVEVTEGKNGFTNKRWFNADTAVEDTPVATPDKAPF